MSNTHISYDMSIAHVLSSVNMSVTHIIFSGMKSLMSKNLPTQDIKRRKPQQARSLERVNRILDVAEELFIADGYNATTTNAIAARAKVSIGSLYQFFPDKAAIVQALAKRYGDLLRQQLAAVDGIDLDAYVDLIIDRSEQFFAEYPGYYAIFMQVQGTIQELSEIEEVNDAELIRDLVVSLKLRDAGLEDEDYEAIAFVLVKAIGNFLWLSLGREKLFRERLVKETKRLTLSYLQSYFL